MQPKKLFIAAVLLFFLCPVHGQLLDKLKQRAKERGLETREVSFDSTDNAVNRTISNEEEELVLKSANDFYNKDVIMKLFNDGQLVQTAYFDSETIAMRTEQVGNANPLYHDDQGKFYAYDKDKGHYSTMKLLPTSSMGFMTAGLTTQAYKLPHEPYFEAFKALEDVGSGLNFLILELAFIYKPAHFENNESYSAQKKTCNGSNDCIRFNYNFPDYPESYIQFDGQGRLNELYINSNSPELKDEPKGKFVFTYQDCKVSIPEAEEQSIIPGPLGKILPIEKGLEPWKYNKADNKKN
ncbi:hypothetical protein [Tamlana flava]|uniref:hypothetical protein n=1 Tax=Tamlana flava TaxID=3158572 RepID=UPI00351B7DDF